MERNHSFFEATYCMVMSGFRCGMIGLTLLVGFSQFSEEKIFEDQVPGLTS
jgi:hypothetical protein